MNKPHNNTIPMNWINRIEYVDAGDKKIETPEQYAALIVLKGHLQLTFNNRHKEISKESLVIIDQKKLVKSSWSAGTEILVFTPPEKIFVFFNSCSIAFATPSSAIIPMIPELKKWTTDLMAEQPKSDKELDDECRRAYCARFAEIIQSYPPTVIGELLVAFQACSMSGSKRCRGKACELPTP